LQVQRGIGFAASQGLLRGGFVSTRKKNGIFLFFYLNNKSTWNIKVLRTVTGPPNRKRISGDEDRRKLDLDEDFPGSVRRVGFAGS
jgi:hypothetical protein